MPAPRHATRSTIRTSSDAGTDPSRTPRVRRRASCGPARRDPPACRRAGTTRVPGVLTLARRVCGQAAVGMPRRATPSAGAGAGAGARAAMPQDAVLRWRSLCHSVTEADPLELAPRPHSPANADCDCAGAGSGAGAGLPVAEGAGAGSARECGGLDSKARAPCASWGGSIGCCSRAHARAHTPRERAPQCRRWPSSRRTTTLINHLVGILFLSLLAASPARAGAVACAVAYVASFTRTRTCRWGFMRAVGRGRESGAARRVELTREHAWPPCRCLLVVTLVQTQDTPCPQ